MSAGPNAVGGAIAAPVQGDTPIRPAAVDMGSKHYLDSHGIAPDRVLQGFPLLPIVF